MIGIEASTENDNQTLEKLRITAIAFQILEKEGNVLLILKRKENLWALPGGHMEMGETSIDAAVRESKEEIGVDILADNESFTLAALVKDRKKERLCVFITASSWEGEPANMEPEEVSEIKWFPKDALPKNIFKTVALGLRDIQSNKPYAEYGF